MVATDTLFVVRSGSVDGLVVRSLLSVALGIVFVGSVAMVLARTLPRSLEHGFPSYAGSQPVFTIRQAIAEPKAEPVVVSGFLALDRAACGRLTEPDPNVCSGAFLWEMSVPDPWYGGSRLSLTMDDVAKRLSPALGIRDWGVPVVAAGTLVEGSCQPSDLCRGVLRLEQVAWVGEPVPQEFKGDRSTDPANDAVDATRILLPASWSAAAADDGWTVSPPAGEVTMSLRKRSERIVYDPASGVWDSYPEAQSITYDYGDDIVIWTVETGTTTATRQTLVGFNDGQVTYELTLHWAHADIWAGASQFALTRIVNGMIAASAETAR